MSHIASIPATDESVVAVMKRFPEQAIPLTELTEAIMRTGECAFSHKEREMIAAYASGTNACTYCFGSHRATAEAFGLDEGLLDALLDNIDASPVEEKFKPILHFVNKLTRTPSKVVKADVDAVLEAGWSENDFHFVVMICGLFNMYNRIMDGYGIENTEAFRSDRGQVLAKQGYGIVIDTLDK